MSIRYITVKIIHGYLENLLFKRIIKGAFWSLLGSILSSILSLIGSMIIARLLGQNVFGELGVIQSTIGLFQLFAGFGLGVTATKYIAEFKNIDINRLGSILAFSKKVSYRIGLIFTIIFFVSSGWIATNTLAAPHLSLSLKLCSLMLVLTAINGFQLGVLQGFELFRLIASLNLIYSISRLIFMVGGIILFKLNGAILGWIFALLLNNFIFDLKIKEIVKTHNIPIAYKESSSEWKILFNFSLPAVLSGALVAPVNWLCNIIIVNQANGFSEMGLYNAANQWWTVILFIPNALANVTLPILSNLIGGNNINDINKSRKLMFVNLFVNGAISSFLSLAICFFSRQIMRGYGEKFEAGSIVLMLLVWSATFASMAKIAGLSIISKSRMWLGFLLNLVWGIIFLSLTWLWRYQGAEGLSKASLFAYMIHFIDSLIYLLIFDKKIRSKI